MYILLELYLRHWAFFYGSLAFGIDLIPEANNQARNVGGKKSGLDFSLKLGILIMFYYPNVNS